MPAKQPRTKKAASTSASGVPFEVSDVRALARLVSQYDLSEIEVEGDNGRLRIKRDRTGNGAAAPGAPPVAGSVMATPAPPPVAPPSTAPAPPAQVSEGEAPDDGSALITSPFVGTFYRAPSPESPPFVEVGQTVKKGQVLCIVEAMKLMNEIEAESDCKILEILPKNAEAVEFGQPLFKVFPLA